MKNIFLIGLFLVVFAGFGCRKACAPSQGPLPVNVVTVVEKGVNEGTHSLGGWTELNRLIRLCVCVWIHYRDSF